MDEDGEGRPAMAEDVHEFMAGVEAQGIRLFLEEGRLQCRGAQARLTPALLEQVRERRDAIVAHLRAGDGAENGAAQGGPLTAGQRSLLLHQRLTPDSVAYNLALVARTDEALDAGRLDRALRSVMTRHAILRTTYRWNDGEPLRCVAEVPLSVLVEVTTATESAESLAEAFVDRPFDLERELPLRAALVRGGPDDGRPVLALAVHHIAADLRSVDVIVEEWLAAYRAEDTAEAVSHSVDFAEQARREQHRLAGPGAADALAFWREELTGLTETQLPFDRPRPPVQTFRGGRHTVELDHRLSAAIGRVARDADATPNMLFLSALQVLLQKYLGADDVVVGTPAANRPTADVQDTVGFFADPVAVRTRLTDDPTFLAALGRTRGTLLRALDHPFPFPLLVERLNPVRDPRRSPFFQVMYVWQQADPDRQPVPLTPLAASGQRGAPTTWSSPSSRCTGASRVHGRTTSTSSTGRPSSGSRTATWHCSTPSPRVRSGGSRSCRSCPARPSRNCAPRPAGRRWTWESCPGSISSTPRCAGPRGPSPWCAASGR